ncbi:Ankyrin repeat domain-containing protein 55 [Exaiptasia diaphana]|nr:Ankyrin repeat domain-containing protein 55 [Exaiptasia diaphana]
MGNLELVQFLATSGAKLDSKDNLGRTPIALASYQGWNDGVYYLLALGANQTMVDNCGRLPLHAATYYSNQRTVQILLKQLPIEYVNTQDCEGMTAFHWAAFHGRADLVALLVENGAELIARDNEGKTPLHWAAQFRMGCAPSSPDQKSRVISEDIESKLDAGNERQPSWERVDGEKTFPSTKGRNSTVSGSTTHVLSTQSLHEESLNEIRKIKLFIQCGKPVDKRKSKDSYCSIKQQKQEFRSREQTW